MGGLHIPGENQFPTCICLKSIALKMSAAAPSDADLQAKAGALKKTETRASGIKADDAVAALYKKTFADNGGDKDKVCTALGLEPASWVDGMDEKAFLAKYIG